MRFLFVIDHLERMNILTDSSIEIMQECAELGIEVHYCYVEDLFFSQGQSIAIATLISLQNKKIKKINAEERELDEFDLIFMRKEPPYDLNYHYVTMILEKTKTAVVNSPSGLRNANEKLAILNFPDIIPKTLVSNNTKRITAFVKSHETTIIKPIHLFGGKGILLLKKNEKDLAKKIEKMTCKGVDYVMCQEFIPSVVKGDKRIILLEGEPLGAMVRVPKKGGFLANMAQGGMPQKYALQKEDLNIIKRIKPYLLEQGLFLVGIDVIGDKLIEINVTCPTGIVQIKKFDKKNITANIVNALIKEAKR